MQSLLLPPLILCVHCEGLLGCSMDFVTPRHQFSGVGFYEPNTTLQEAHIKMLACFLHHTWLSSCFHLLICLHCCSRARTFFLIWICFSYHFLLVADDDTTLHLGRWHPAARCKPNLDSHFTDFAFAALQSSLFCCPFFGHNKSLREAERRLESDITLNWIFSIGQIHLLYCLQK